MAKREIATIQAVEFSQPVKRGIHSLFKKAGKFLEEKELTPIYTIYSQDEHGVEYLTVLYE